MKIAVVTCYKHPDHSRPQTLRSALKKLDYCDVRIIKNSHQGLLRYPEVIIKIMRCRLNWHPDVWLLTFRGYEILPWLWLLSWPKPVIFDELINFMEWTVDEHHKLKADGLLSRIISFIYSCLLRRCRFILADTQIHAAYSAAKSHISIKKYWVIPVGAIEELPETKLSKNKFQVLYYGTMLPLHGLDYVLKAAENLCSQPEINFVIVGGKAKELADIEAAKQHGAHIDYIRWLKFKELLKLIGQSDIGLGGPFGNTVQAQMVITSKTYQFLAYHIPVIIGQSDCLEHFANHRNCLIVPQADAAKLTESINWAYQHPEQLQAIGLAGQKLYSTYFSVQSIKDVLDQMISQLV